MSSTATLTPSVLRVLEALEKSSGNVADAAAKLELSISYVNRVKSEHWGKFHPEDLELVRNQVEQAFLEPLLNSELSDIQQLKNSVLLSLNERVNDNELSSRELVSLAKVLLEHEATLLKTSKVEDNRHQTINVTGLVEEMAGMDPEKLRALVGGKDVQQ